MSNHMLRPTITDMQDKYCGTCYDICLIQNQYKGNHKRGSAAFVLSPQYLACMSVLLGLTMCD